jgi:hypothetical protein
VAASGLVAAEAAKAYLAMQEILLFQFPIFFSVLGFANVTLLQNPVCITRWQKIESFHPS